MNPLINKNTNNKPMNFGQLYSQVMQNPTAFLSQLGIPANINTPQGAVQYLLNSGKITQEQVNQAQIKAQQLQKQIQR